MKITLLKISQLLLFLLIVSINLREPYLHSREILYFLFVPLSLVYCSYRKINSFVLFICIWAISFLYNIIIPGSNAINGNWLESVINAAYLLLLIFSNKRYYHIIIKAFVVSSIIISIITIVVWVLCDTNEAIRTELSAYFQNMKINEDITVMKIDSRFILGHPFFFVWYRTSPVMIPALGYFYIKRLKGEKKIKNFICIVLLTIALFLSGTRANMLCACMFLFLYMVFKLCKEKHFIIASLFFLLTMSSGSVVAYKFLHDKKSVSTNIKQLHQEAYFRTFKSDYIRTMFFGWGCGSTFYTKGFNKNVTLTELSHWETIRRYGVVSFVLIMFFIWLRPLILKMRIERGLSKYFYVVIVLAYIFVACTNPFLLDSIGFCVLLFFDAFFEYDNFNSFNNLQRRTVPAGAA